MYEVYKIVSVSNMWIIKVSWVNIDETEMSTNITINLLTDRDFIKEIKFKQFMYKTLSF